MQGIADGVGWVTRSGRGRGQVLQPVAPPAAAIIQQQPAVTVTMDAPVEPQLPAATKKGKGKQNNRMTVNSLAGIVSDMKNDQGNCMNRVVSLEGCVRGVSEQLKILIDMNCQQNANQRAPVSQITPAPAPVIDIPLVPQQAQPIANIPMPVSHPVQTCHVASPVMQCEPQQPSVHVPLAAQAPTSAVAGQCPLPPPGELVRRQNRDGRIDAILSNEEF